MTFRSHPSPAEWDDFVGYESTSWPKKDPRRYWIIPSICFNCESACGILAYVDKETLEVRKIEGNPAHPGSLLWLAVFIPVLTFLSLALLRKQERYL